MGIKFSIGVMFRVNTEKNEIFPATSTGRNEKMLLVQGCISRIQACYDAASSTWTREARDTPLLQEMLFR